MEWTMANKLLLAVIGLGLWANAAILLMRPASAQGDAFTQSAQGDAFKQIARDLHALVQGGLDCHNSKLCD
jgi:hypothetical protein